MFKKKYRFPAQTRLSNSTSLFSQAFILKISFNTLGYNRFGMIVSKKIDKRAVERNRLKRLIRSCLEDMQIKLKPGYDMLFILRKEALGKKRTQLYQEVESAMKAKKIV